jgi:8-oxo-dGTP diphosphatase
VSPRAPVVGVGGVLVHEGRVLLARRGKEPLLGRWVVPGGTVELGETLEEALVREMEEEAGLRVEPAGVLAVFDRIDREGERVVRHYVVVDFLCRWLAGEARAGSDALEVAWAAPEELAGYDLPPRALEVVRDGLARAASPPTGDGPPQSR